MEETASLPKSLRKKEFCAAGRFPEPTPAAAVLGRLPTPPVSDGLSDFCGR